MPCRAVTDREGGEVVAVAETPLRDIVLVDGFGPRHSCFSWVADFSGAFPLDAVYSREEWILVLAECLLRVGLLQE
eukprot:SAG11_NODE_2050_length_3882_cov_13.229842_6_plen_76_part_00